MPDLTTLAELKVLMGITGTSEDGYLGAMLSSESQNFMNLIHRQDFSPVAMFTDYLSGNDSPYIYLNHYPIVAITSLKINGVVVPVWSSGTPDTLGYIFDNTVPIENRVKLWLRGAGNIFPRWYGTPYSYPWDYYGIEVVYTAGYAIADVPANVKRALAEIIAIKRGITQLQAGTSALQTGTTLTLGDYQQGDTSGSSTSTSVIAGTEELPTSIQSVIDQYAKPQI